MVYEVNAGYCFLIYPNQIAFYQADTNEPWEYYWLGICGVIADDMLQTIGFNYNRMVIPFKSDIICKTITKITDEAIKHETDEIAIYLQLGSLIRKVLYYLMEYKYFSPWEWRPNSKGISGWCSWEAYHRDITEENVADAARLMSVLVPYGLEYIQLDDGYQQVLIPPEKDGKVYESWLKPNEKFPGGHEEITGSVRRQGLVPFSVKTEGMLYRVTVTFDREDAELVVKQDTPGFY